MNCMQNRTKVKGWSFYPGTQDEEMMIFAVSHTHLESTLESLSKISNLLWVKQDELSV